ncbi:MAG: addiction module protein [Calditrichaceae bacterium]|nr:addiction module protein [Calditrichaceae bacterium]MBN2709810.1 addiction module protein [Calditrichaceae bacterium]
MINKDITSQILNLKSSQKIELIDMLYESLDKPDLDIQQEWIKESEKRYDKYKAGQLKSYSYEEVMKMLDK